MKDTIYIKGVWYEIEITECKTWVILRNREGVETKFYNDAEGAEEMTKFILG